ncbi:metallophosphoesterase [Candidatus Latescibacterota bacterium]
MKKSVILIVCFLYGTLNVSHAEQPHFSTVPYLQNPAEENVTIMWHTDTPAYGWIEYGKTDAFGEKADMVVDGLRNANTTRHKIRLANLEPGTTYFYRACIKPIKKFEPYRVVFEDIVYSETYTFQTLSAGGSPISFAIFNDLHNNYAMFDSLCATVDGIDYQFSVFNGDCFADPQSEKDVIEALTNYNAGITANSRPPIYIRGNHESRGSYARELKKNFDFPGDEFFFAMTAGPVRLIFLDCGEDKTDDHEEYSGLTDFSGYRERQKEWLAEEVTSSAFKNAKYRILIHHIPLYTDNNRGISRFSRALWSPILDEVPIDLAINGHIHRYAFVPAHAADNSYPVLSGGGSIYGTVMVLTVVDDQLHVKVLNAEGNIMGNFSKQGNDMMKAVPVSGE